MKKILFLVLLFQMNSVTAEQASVVWYSEQEEGVEPDRVRYIVTRRFLRSDDGRAENGFLLLDRQKKMVYSVTPETRSILSINGNTKLQKAPATLDIQTQQSEDDSAPKIAGRQTRHIEVSANQRTCYNAIVADGLYDDVRRAFLELQEVLAVQQTQLLERTPLELRTDCYLTRYVYAPARHLLYGLPVEEWDGEGRRRQLLDFGTEEVDAGMFELPADYSRYSPVSE